MAFPELSLGRLNGLCRAGWLDGTVPLGFGLMLVTLTPWQKAFEFGTDEGFELMKGWLVSRGHALYGPFWNDQPPLHTEMLAFLFWLFGPSAGVGRLLSIGLAAVLVGALYGLARRGVNRLAGLLAVVLLASASEFLKLSVSVMLELPAFALGMAAVWAWHRWVDGGGRGWLVGSGVLLGSALQVKFTAALLLPAFAGVWWLRAASGEFGRTPNGFRPSRFPWRDGLFWLGGLVGSFGLVVLVWYGSGAWTMFVRSHFSAATREQLGNVIIPGPNLGLWLEDGGLVFLALLGLTLQLWQRRREGWFPVIWLVTAVVVHWHHRPWWSYYWLHFAIPLAWLAGAGVVEGFRLIWRRFPTADRAGWWLRGLAWVSWSLALAGGLSLALGKAVWELERLRTVLPADQRQAVQALRTHGAGVQWVFTHDMLSAFWARLPIPPELAVIPYKRRVSGQLPQEQVIEVLERYRPGLILLPPQRISWYNLENYIKASYQAVPGAADLYRRK